MPQKIRMRKMEQERKRAHQGEEMEAGEMTGKMYAKKEMAEHRAEMQKSMQKKDMPMSAKEKMKAEMDYKKLKAEDKKLNQPTSTKRVVGVIMTRKPAIAKKIMERIASKKK